MGKPLPFWSCCHLLLDIPLPCQAAPLLLLFDNLLSAVPFPLLINLSSLAKKQKALLCVKAFLADM